MKNEDLQKWALGAEIIGGIAVTVTLIILIIEVRENTSVMRMAAYQDEIDRSNEWRYNVTADPDQRYVIQQWALDNAESLDPAQEFTLRLILSSLFSQRESAYFARENGFLGDSEWQRMLVPTCAAYNRTVANTDMWMRLAGALTSEFVTLLESEC